MHQRRVGSIRNVHYHSPWLSAAAACVRVATSGKNLLLLCELAMNKTVPSRFCLTIHTSLPKSCELVEEGAHGVSHCRFFLACPLVKIRRYYPPPFVLSSERASRPEYRRIVLNILILILQRITAARYCIRVFHGKIVEQQCCGLAHQTEHQMFLG